MAHHLRFLILLPVAVWLMGCGTISFTSPRLITVSELEARAYRPVPAPTPTPGAAVTRPVSPGTVQSRPLSTPKAGSYRYGRFEVAVAPDGSQTIRGGEFTPHAEPPQAATAKHALFVDYTTKELTYYRRSETGEYRPVVGYAVVTPHTPSLPQPVVRGRVTLIDERPTWCPTPNIRRADPSLPPGCLPFGHPQNAMGVAKFMIDWEVRGWSLIRIHGAGGYPRGNFWEEETFGCTRLEDRALQALIERLGPRAVREGIEVVVLGSNPSTANDL